MKFLKSSLALHKTLLFFTLIFINTVTYAWSASSDYAGFYAGTYSGSDNGYWVSVFETDPGEAMFFTYSNTLGKGDLGELSYTGESGTVGTYTGTTYVFENAVSANVDTSDSSVSGTWAAQGGTGTFTGNSVTSVSYAGTYTGTLSGDSASGTWTMTVASSGHITGSITTDTAHTFQGASHPDGYIFCIGDGEGDNGFLLYGMVSGTGISGHWIAESETEGEFDEGTFSGSSGNDSGGTDDEDDEDEEEDDELPSCFLKSL